MNPYVTGAVIIKLREDSHMTQTELAGKLAVSDKAISRWETGRGYPDITLLEPLASALGISLIELLSGSTVSNTNRTANMRKSVFYVCPVCGNAICASGEAVVSCCGITLPPLEADEADEDHRIRVERIENEWYVTAEHPMTKSHSLTFFAAVGPAGVQFVRLYPEGPAEAYFRISGVRTLYACCNRHGLFRLDIRSAGKP